MLNLLQKKDCPKSEPDRFGPVASNNDDYHNCNSSPYGSFAKSLFYKGLDAAAVLPNTPLLCGFYKSDDSHGYDIIGRRTNYHTNRFFVVDTRLGHRGSSLPCGSEGERRDDLFLEPIGYYDLAPCLVRGRGRRMIQNINLRSAMSSVEEEEKCM